MPFSDWIRRRRRIAIPLSIGVLVLSAFVLTNDAEPQSSRLTAAQDWLPPPRLEPRTPSLCPAVRNPDPLMGPRTRLPGHWRGRVRVQRTLPIVVMAGHADSQKMAGSGTPGYAVDVLKQIPMDHRMRDELFWNFLVQQEVVRLGKLRGLNITGYTPPALTIPSHADPRTNWAQAKTRSARGEYILEIHFDAYSPYGFGSGLIPAINRSLNTVDESLADVFGRFPRDFRGGLGGPRRGIGILEIGMLQGELERRLRDPNQRQATVECLASRVVDALADGVGLD